MSYRERGLRNGHERCFDFLELDLQIVQQHCSNEIILAFGPTERKTYGGGWIGFGVAKANEQKRELSLAVLRQLT
jgi:hypothetical protein